MEREAPSSFTDSVCPPAFLVSPSHVLPKTSRSTTAPRQPLAFLAPGPSLLGGIPPLCPGLPQDCARYPSNRHRGIACLYPTDKPFEGHADSICFRHPLTQHRDLPCSALSWHDFHLLLKCLHTVKSDEPASTVMVPSAGNGVALLTTGFRKPRLQALGHHRPPAPPPGFCSHCTPIPQRRPVPLRVQTPPPS